jgi:hypothetical protein
MRDSIQYYRPDDPEWRMWKIQGKNASHTHEMVDYGTTIRPTARPN